MKEKNVCLSSTNVFPLQCIFLNLVVNDDAWVVTLSDLVKVYAYLSAKTHYWGVL
jgi:hypothetical protein